MGWEFGIIIPLFFFLFMQFVFSGIFSNSYSQIGTQFTILSSPTFPNSTNFQSNSSQLNLFGFKEIQYFGAVITTGFAKIGALITILFLVFTPPASLPASVSTPIFLIFYLPAYAFMGVGMVKVFNPMGS